MQPLSDYSTIHKLAVDTIQSAAFRRATFGGVQRGPGDAKWKRVLLRPVELRGERFIQFSYFDERKDITKNYRGEDWIERLEEVLNVGFSAIHLETTQEEIDLRTSKKGKVQIGRRKLAASRNVDLAHNRTKDVPLPEGKADHLLETLGILTRGGTVKPTMRAKYTQINELLKHLKHALDESSLKGLDRPLQILDCGCGLSYLTLAAHHYLNHILHIPANLLGVDVNEEVIRKSMERSEKLDARGLSFSCNPIEASQWKPDIVLALHACDTATDDAIARAVTSEASVLLSVPCCHHHLNAQLHATGEALTLRPILRHGILHQRTADIVTDAFRALALRILGYRTDVVEFISPEHTARNLLLRAVRGASVGEEMFVREYQTLRRFWNVKPYIEDALGEPFQSLVSSP